jgi:hypothetical protein
MLHSSVTTYTKRKLSTSVDHYIYIYNSINVSKSYYSTQLHSKNKTEPFSTQSNQIKTFAFRLGGRAAVCSEAVSAVRKCTYEVALRYLTG